MSSIGSIQHSRGILNKLKPPRLSFPSGSLGRGDLDGVWAWGSQCPRTQLNHRSIFQIHFMTNKHQSPQSKSQLSSKSTSANQTILSKNRLIYIGSLIAAGVGSIICYERYWLRKTFESIIPPHPELIGETVPSKYLQTTLSPSGILGAPWYYQYLPWVSWCQAPVWFYVFQTKNPDLAARKEAIQNLASLRGLTNLECQSIAQAIDFKTAVALAHAGADPRMILVPKIIQPEALNMCFASTFRKIIDHLPPESINEVMFNTCISALRSFRPTEQEAHDRHLDVTSGFECDLTLITKPLRELPESSFLVPCLQALLSHARILEQIPVILQHNGMDLLLAVSQRFRNDPAIMGLVIKILCSISCHPDSDESFEKSGILRFVVELSTDEDVKLSFPARKVLHNLDRENSKYILPPGLYQLYPDFRSNEDNLKVDVVFVHGIMGGVFRTWRSQDKEAVWRFTKVDPNNKYSLCEALKQESKWKKRITDIRRRITNSEPILEKKIEKTPLEPLCAADEEDNKSYFRQRFDEIRSKFRAGLFPADVSPINREFRDGKLFYFPTGEDIPLETGILDEFSPKSNCWPRDWLPTDLSNIRILAADFDTFVTHWNQVMPVESVGRTIHERGEEMLHKVIRAGIGDRPIVWVTHSAGGIIIKQLLDLADKSDDPKARNIAKQTSGVIFCSTPHKGSGIANVGSKGLPKSILLPTIEIIQLTKNSEELKQINDRFKELMEKYNYFTVSFGELCPTIGSMGMPTKLVTVDSSDPGYGEFYGLKIDHLNICKPRSKKSFVYIKIKDVIENVLKEIDEHAAISKNPKNKKPGTPPTSTDKDQDEKNPKDMQPKPKV